VKWPEAGTTEELVNITMGQSPITTYQLLEEECWVATFLTQQARNCATDTTSSEEKWVRIFKHFNEKNIPLPNSVKVTEFVFSLPGISGPVKYVPSHEQCMAT
jgi:hypothetical protein